MARLPAGARIGRARIGAARHKYGARRTPCRAGHQHASKAEAERCDQLQLLLRADKIAELEQQPRFPLMVPDIVTDDGACHAGDNITDLGTYIADFRYRERLVGMSGYRGTPIVEDVKGFDTPASRLRRRLAEALYGIQVRIIRKGTR